MDVGLNWSNDSSDGQWLLANGDLVPGNDLESAVMVSLFTDRYATDDFTPTDGTTNRRGWWGNTYEATEIGSNLYQLDRAYYSGASNILLQARDYCKDALQWLIDGGIAASISVLTAKSGQNGMIISIVITRPVTNIKVPFQFSYYWRQELGSAA